MTASMIAVMRSRAGKKSTVPRCFGHLARIKVAKRPVRPRSTVAGLSRCCSHSGFAAAAPLTGQRCRGTVAGVDGGRGAAKGLEGMSRRIGCLALLLVVIGAAISPLHAANIIEKNFWLSGPRYDRIMPPCDFPPALDRIMGDFRTKEARFWNSRLQILGIENIHQTAVLPWAAQDIPRRFCSGTAVINDGARHAIFYSIAEDTGLIGQDFGVNFCVVGLDRNWAYGPACRAARP